MKKYKNKSMYLTLAILLFLIGVGYAVLTANLTINGTSGIANATWDVHFENPNSTANSSVTPSVAPTADPSDKVQSISYTVTFNEPGDIYEFTVDVANRGSIDAMINTITSTYQIGDADPVNLLENDPPAYLDYYVTYSDGTAVTQKQKLVHSTTEELVVHVEFKREITNAQFEQAVGKSIVFTYGLEYIQTDGTEIKVPHPQTGAEQILETAQTSGQLNRIEDTDIYIFKGGTDNPPANYVKFNNEDWRIMGIYDDQLKIIRVDGPTGSPTAPTSFISIEWNTTSTAPKWEDSSLKEALNNETTGYYSTLTSTAKSMIDENGIWNVGPVLSDVIAREAYISATTTGTVGSIEHTTPWTGKIGLMTSYEYMYASGGGDTCLTTVGNFYSINCGTAENDWLSNIGTNVWTLSPFGGRVSHAVNIYSSGTTNASDVTKKYMAVPVVYLKPSVKIVSGDGTNPTNAYVLQLNE